MIALLDFLLSPWGIVILIVILIVAVTISEQDRLRKKAAEDRARWLARDDETRPEA